MRLEQLAYLQEIGKQGNMTRAAEALYISQPTLSEAIKRLERELDITLLERCHSGVSLTEAGQQVVATAETVFDQLDTLHKQLDLLKRKQAANQKQIYLEVTPFLGNTYLFQFLQACREQAKWEITAEIHDAAEIIERVAQQKIQAGIVLLEQQMAQRLQHTFADVSFYLLRAGHLQVVLRQNHPLCNAAVIPLQQFSQYPILFPKNSCIPVREILQQHGAEPSILESAIYTLPQQFIKEQDGICLISSVLLDYFTEHPFDSQEFVTKELELTISTNLYFVLEQSDAKQSMGMALQQFAADYFGQMD